jgi:biotin carboxyl carrier protein
VSPGAAVAAGHGVAVLEAMKMETHLATTAAGTVTDIRVMPGDVVEAGQVVVVVD